MKRLNRCKKQAIEIGEKRLGSEHPKLATWLNNLAGLYSDQGKYEEAELLYERALAIYERKLGPNHPYTVSTRESYAFLKEVLNEERI
jgi:tetratricopeptide (TPR) repeat protein